MSSTTLARRLSGDEIEVMERQDSQQILAAMEGAHLDVFVYDIEINGRMVSGISYAGTIELARRRGNIQAGVVNGQVVAPQVQDTQDAEGKPAVRVTIPAQDVQTGNVIWGMAEEPLMERTKKGDRPDKKAAIKALSKAQRNAIRGLLPVALIEELIARAKDKERQRVAVPPETRPQDGSTPSPQGGAATETGESCPKCKVGHLSEKRGEKEGRPWHGMFCDQPRAKCGYVRWIKDDAPKTEEAEPEEDPEPGPFPSEPESEPVAAPAPEPVQAEPTSPDAGNVVGKCKEVYAALLAEGMAPDEIKLPTSTNTAVWSNWYNRHSATLRRVKAGSGK